MARGHSTRIVLAAVIVLLLSICATAGNWQEYHIYASGDEQSEPDVHGTLIVWHQYVEQYGDYDIYIADVNNPVEPDVFVIGDANDQMYPAVYDNAVVWQDHVFWQGSSDWDIRLADITDPDNMQMYAVANEVDIDEVRPAVHGSSVVWRSGTGEGADVYGADVSDLEWPLQFPIATFEHGQENAAVYRTTAVWEDSFFGDWDIYSADIWEKNKPVEFSVALFEADQTNPAVSGTVVVYQDNYFGDSDIYGVDISDPDNPVEIIVANNQSEQTNPDIHANIVVWQDNRDGNWDIYGYNLTTRTEFQITDNPADQTNPVIHGSLVAWADKRGGVSNIYAAFLDGPEVAACTKSLAGDANGDCRVDFGDLAVMASNWLQCGLEPDAGCLPAATGFTLTDIPSMRRLR